MAGTIGKFTDIEVRSVTYTGTNSATAVTYGEGQNIATGTTTGTIFGTTAAQKIGFFAATPVVQPATTGTSTGFTAGGGTTATSTSTFTGNTGSSAYTVGDIVKALKNLGLLAA